MDSDLVYLKNSSDILVDCSKRLFPFYYTDPINRDKQKKLFLSGEIKEPSLAYRPLEYSPCEIFERLSKVNVPNKGLGGLINSVKDELMITNEVIQSIGDSKKIRNLTSKLLGKPTKSLVSKAKEILNEYKEEKLDLVVSSQEMKSAFEKEILSYGLTDWKVEFSVKEVVTVEDSNKKLNLNFDRKYSEKEKKGLVLHEVNGHVLRSANGYLQPISIFAIGLANSILTEEGLASYLEELGGIANTNRLREFAGRVIAVDSMLHNDKFSETFSKLKEFNFSEDYAWKISLRAHRAGGYVRDHIYLQGYLEVKEFAKKGNDLKQLYFGQVGLADLSIVKKLFKKRVLVAPKLIPRILQTSNFNKIV